MGHPQAVRKVRFGAPNVFIRCAFVLSRRSIRRAPSACEYCPGKVLRHGPPRGAAATMRRLGGYFAGLSIMRLIGPRVRETSRRRRPCAAEVPVGRIVPSVWVAVASVLPAYHLVLGKHGSLVAGNQLLDHVETGAQPGRVAALHKVAQPDGTAAPSASNWRAADAVCAVQPLPCTWLSFFKTFEGTGAAKCTSLRGCSS